MIVATLVGQIESADTRQALRKPTTSLAAYEFFLRGVVHMRSYGPEDNRQACAMFEAALERDPNFALAHAHLALAKISLHGYANAPSMFSTRPSRLRERQSRSMRPKAVASVCWPSSMSTAGNSSWRNDTIVAPFSSIRMTRMHWCRWAACSPGAASSRKRWNGLTRDLPAQSVSTAVVQRRSRQRTLYTRQIRGGRSSAQGTAQSRSIDLRSLVACYAQAGALVATEDAKARLLKVCPDFSTEDFIKRGLLLERPEQLDLFRQGLLKAGLPE